jgi:N-acetylmuramoyl-L-alanine amidase
VIPLLLALAAGPPPRPPRAPLAITVSTARGDARVPVRAGRGGAPLVPAAPLLAALGGTVRREGAWAEVSLARQEFDLLIDAPWFVFAGRAEPLAAAATVSRDSVFLPLQFVVEVLPKVFSERYRYDGDAARFIEVTPRLASAPEPAPALPVSTVSAPRTAVDRPPAGAGGAGDRLRSGLRRGHVVTVDAGHGGVDPGNPGLYFPRGTREKDVTLQIALLLRDELKRRGIGVRMTRTSDTLIALGDRGRYCVEDCDLFVSLHVNSLPRRAGYTAMRGFETYFLAEAKTEDAARVAKVENDAVRFETVPEEAPTGGLDFILKDLQMNEHLRESAQLAAIVQDKVGDVHTSPDRGVKQAGFMVLTTARRPAVLVEMGYSTNPEDGRFLSTPSTQRKLASAIADAIVDYLLDYERRTGTAADSGDGR